MRPQTPLHSHSVRVVNPEVARTTKEQVYFDRGNTIYNAVLKMGASVHRNYAEVQKPAPRINTQAMFSNSAPIGRTAIAAPEFGVTKPVVTGPDINPIQQIIDANALPGAEMNRAFEEIDR